MTKRIPAHIFWPGMVVALLLFTVATQTALLMAAQSDGGEQIEADYYARSLKWDELQALRGQSKALGWQATLGFPAQSAPSPEGRTVEVTLKDADGAPLEALTGTLELRRPSLVGVASLEPLVAAPHRPGVYLSKAKINAVGLWDFTIHVHKSAEDPTEVFMAEIRQEF